jgi:2-polyprenyl-6-hydroxyphenyl methylase / 3-demethylubiquinone-9 3-methyltransferase
MPPVMVGSSDGSGARNPQTEAASAAEGPSIDPADVARFSAQAAEWWDPKGPFAPLHRFNPARLAFLRDRFEARFDRRGRGAFEGLSLIDVGCGGGLIAEPMRRLGFAVTGVDAPRTSAPPARTPNRWG